MPSDGETPTTLRWGLAGYGDLARRRIAPALAARKELSAIWGRRLRPAEMLAAAYGARVATDDFATFLTAVDVVYVATPVGTHVPLAARSLAAGRAVLIEKPLNVGLSSVKPLLGASRPLVGVAYYRRLAKALQDVRQALRSARFGKPRSVRINFATQFAPGPNDPQVWRLARDLAGAGVLADAGSHRIDLLLWFFGRPMTVKAWLTNFTPRGVERSARLVMRWQDGLEAECWFEWNGRYADRLVIEFLNDAIVLDPLDAGWSDPDRPRSKGEQAASVNPHGDLIADFEQAMAGLCAPCCGLQDALDVDAIILAALRSGGRAITPNWDATNA